MFLSILPQPALKQRRGQRVNPGVTYMVSEAAAATPRSCGGRLPLAFHAFGEGGGSWWPLGAHKGALDPGT